MITTERVRRLKAQLDLSSSLTENLYCELLDLVGDTCRSCSKQKDCWKPNKFYWLAEVSVKEGKDWICANYIPLSCASVMGRPITIRVGGK